MQHKGTGEVGVLGKLGFGETSMQYKQGRGSNGISMEQGLETESGLGWSIFAGRMDIYTVLVVDKFIRFGGISVVIGVENSNTEGLNLTNGRDYIAGLFSINLVICLTLLNSLAGLSWHILNSLAGDPNFGWWKWTWARYRQNWRIWVCGASSRRFLY